MPALQQFTHPSKWFYQFLTEPVGFVSPYRLKVAQQHSQAITPCIQELERLLEASGDSAMDTQWRTAHTERRGTLSTNWIGLPERAEKKRESLSLFLVWLSFFYWGQGGGKKKPLQYSRFKIMCRDGTIRVGFSVIFLLIEMLRTDFVFFFLYKKSVLQMTCCSILSFWFCVCVCVCALIQIPLTVYPHYLKLQSCLVVCVYIRFAMIV